MGSVKDLKILKKPEKNAHGLAIFNFSDRYSVFDWGEMPDTIHDKGSAIAILGAFFFEKLERLGIRTHYKGLVEDNNPMPLTKLKKPSNLMMIDLVNVYPPTVHNGVYDYSVYKNSMDNYLIPLEIIYRNTLPKGSSVFKRLSRGEISFSDLGLDAEPTPDTKLNTPFVDFSTKLEITDRYISRSEAKDISGLNDDEMSKLSEMTLEINRIISSEFEKIKAENLDGKIEAAKNINGDIMLVDIFGTLDECRFNQNGFHLSKEAARIYYRNTDWYFETERAKEKDRQNWKTECKLQPRPLPLRFNTLLSFMYCKVTNEITGRKWFDVPLTLSDIVDEIRNYTK